MPDDPDDAEEAIYQAATQLPHYWVTLKLVEVSTDSRTVRLDAATGMGAVTGYARLSEGTLGEVIASFTLNVPEGFGSWNSSPATVSFLRYDAARSSVDYIVHLEDPADWSLEGATKVGEDFAANVGDTSPAVIFQQLIDAYPALDVHPLSLEQAQEMGWPPRAEDPPFEHLWRSVDLSTD